MVGASAAQPQERPAALVGADVVELLRERLAEGLTGEQWQGVVRDLVAGIEITTIINEHGPKDAKAHIATASLQMSPLAPARVQLV